MTVLHPKQKNIKSSIFSIPSKLYGREAEVENMLKSFERIRQGSTEIVMISGSSGVGKSSLVSEFERLIEKDSLLGYVITGKCDKLERNIPYYPIIQAFEEIVRDILDTSSDGELLHWKKRLQNALGGIGKVLTDLIPSIEKIIGVQPDIPVVSGKEAMNRFNYAFQKFITTIATKSRPLILFLDDLQWIDSASLSLLENITNNPQVKYMMFIGSYRDNEVNEKHPLTKTLSRIEAKSFNKGTRVVYTMHLHNLSVKDLETMIAETLREERESVIDLAEIIFEKTLGNPLFSRQLLKQLYEEEQIQYNTYRYKWLWNTDAIKTINITDNVVDLMVKKIKSLPESTVNILKTASCVGRVFSPKVIEEINERMSTDAYDTVFNATTKHLKKAESEGLIIFERGQYKFAHDRIHQAVNSLNSEIFQKKVHLHIGRLQFAKSITGNFSVENTSSSNLTSDEIFNIINHWNKGVIFIDSKIERSQLATLNLMAGRRAASTAAYEAALNYLSTGISLLYDDSWERDYKLTLALYSDLMEAEYLSGQLDNLEQRFDYIIKNANEPLDTTKAYEVRIQAASAQHNLQQATDLGIEILDKLGMKMPKKANSLHLVGGILMTVVLMIGKRLDKLMELPDMTDEKAKAIMRIFQSIAVPIYLGGSKLLSLYIYKGLRHVFKYGNTADAIFAYGGYGLLCSSVLRKYDTGMRISRILDILIEKFDATRNRSFASLVKYTFLEHPKRHIATALEPLEESYKNGLEMGEVEFTTYVGFVYSYFSFYRGVPLSEAIEVMKRVMQRTKDCNQELAYQRMIIYQQTMLNLYQTSTDNPIVIKGEVYDENEMLPKELEKDKIIIRNQFLMNKMLVCFLFGDYINAAYYAMDNEKNLVSGRGSYMLRLYYFYSVLIYCAALERERDWNQTTLSKRKLKKKIKTYIKVLQGYSETVSENFLHKYKLAQAEYFRIEGKKKDAKEAYRAAILLAEKEEFTNEVGLACELAANFYLQENEILKAKAHINKALRSYTEWEAFTKVEQVKTVYKDILN